MARLGCGGHRKGCLCPPSRPSLVSSPCWAWPWCVLVWPGQLWESCSESLGLEAGSTGFIVQGLGFESPDLDLSSCWGATPSLGSLDPS